MQIFRAFSSKTITCFCGYEKYFQPIEPGFYFLFSEKKMFRSAMYFYYKTLIVFISALFILSSPLSATNYYVDSQNGNDTNDGLAPTPGSGKVGPWKSLVKMNDYGNEEGYLPGDSILFKTDSEWRDVTFKVTRSGNQDAPIYYGAYGTGRKPRIGRAEINIDASYIIVENFISKNSPTNGVARKTGRHVIIRNIDIYNAGQNGIRIVGYDSEKFEDILVEGCNIENSMVDGITIHKGAAFGEAGSGFIFRNNTSNGNGEQGFDLTSGRNILLEGNSTEGNTVGSVVIGRGVRKVNIQKHFSINDFIGLNLKRCWDVRVEYSIFVGSGGEDLVRTDENTDGGSPSRITLVNNVFWQKEHSDIGKFYSSDGPITFKNNFFKGAAEIPVFSFKNNESPLKSGNYLFDNNFYNDGTPENNPILVDIFDVEYTIDRFQNTFDQEPLGGVLNPGFENYTGSFEHPFDFQINTNSNMIDKGADVGASEDFEGNLVPQGGIPDIGAFEVISTGSLPVEWDQVEVTPDVDRSLIDISWSTTTEINNEYFTVEKSIDGALFQTVETVQSKGEGRERRDYNVIDTSPSPGVSYYRIKQVDLDGRFTFSPIMRTEFFKRDDNRITVYPSLTQSGEQLTIMHSHSEGKMVEIKLMDMHGKTILTKNNVADSFQTPFELPQQMVPGYYIITVSLNDTFKGFRIKVN